MLSFMVVTALDASFWMPAAISAIRLADSPDCSASLRTWSATTANPLPCSPARAASIVALRASMFVCEAIPLMTPTRLPISCERFTNPITCLESESMEH
ncbi:hypothetical protein D3C86_1884820 [compost metagenome]